MLLSGCTTEEVVFDAEEQLALDMKLVDDFLNTHDITATRHPGGFHYIIKEQGDAGPVNSSCRWSLELTVFHLDSTYAFSTIEDIEIARGFPEPYMEEFDFYHCRPYALRPEVLKSLGGLIGLGGQIELFVPSGLAWATEGYERHFYPFTPDLERLIEIPPHTNVLISAELIEVE